ncbi:MAG: extensin family protein [Pseudomonas sp.]|uniref:extensin-like domain-containing protein n=1 Tax=Pseudomonas abieticivorans TaxID=2931382 RepID=UPI0020BFBB87|nr:extensin family protein [Pseudomonas sp. PIA16]MDE1166017.1 extensin family protein [Pseudomonas sp.]
MRWLRRLLIVAALGVALWQGLLALPAAWNPWAPLDVREAPNLLTRFKLARLQHDPGLCEQALATSALRYSHQADSPAQADCPLHDVLRVQGSAVGLSSSFLASCPLAVAFALFEVHGLQPAAQSVLGQAVVRVDHLGSFACRTVYGRPGARLSQHASANALDIAGFGLADGRRITVLQDWGKDTDAGRFLQAVHQGACGSFNTVLGPQYNAAHRNHFHVDMGGWAICR